MHDPHPSEDQPSLPQILYALALQKQSKEMNKSSNSNASAATEHV